MMSTRSISIAVSALFVLLTVGPQALARDSNQETTACPEIDLRAEFGEPRFQDDIGWCYANATADMLTYYYKKDLKGERASAAYVALANNAATGKAATAEGGHMDEAFRTSVLRGMCPGSGESAIIMSGPQGPFKEKLEALVQFKKEYDGIPFSPAYREAFGQHVSALQKSKSSLFTLMSGSVLNQILASTTPENFPLTVADYMCRGKRVKPSGLPPKLTTISKETILDYRSDFTNFIDSALKKGFPVSIEYDSRFLITDAYPEKGLFRPWKPRDPQIASHASVIVGEHWNGSLHRCEWILRNSRGMRCGYKNPELRQSCEKGHVFVEKSYLESLSFAATTFKSPRPL